MQLETNRGAFIASATPKEAADLYAARRVIESETVSVLARHCTANDIRALRQHIDAERQACERDNLQDLVRIRSGFHLKIAELAGNQILVKLLEQILPRTAMIATLYRHSPRSPVATQEHEELIRLLMVGDADGCVRLMREHLEFDERNLQIPDKVSNRRVDLASVLKVPTTSGTP